MERVHYCIVKCQKKYLDEQSKETLWRKRERYLLDPIFSLGTIYSQFTEICVVSTDCSTTPYVHQSAHFK